MSDENPMGQVIQIDEARIRDHRTIECYKVAYRVLTWLLGANRITSRN
jgi:hypothetical protein